MTQEEITMIRTALRERGETVLREGRARKYAGLRFRQTRQHFRDDARRYLQLADKPDEYFGKES